MTRNNARCRSSRSAEDSAAASGKSTASARSISAAENGCAPNARSSSASCGLAAEQTFRVQTESACLLQRARRGIGNRMSLSPCERIFRGLEVGYNSGCLTILCASISLHE